MTKRRPTPLGLLTPVLAEDLNDSVRSSQPGDLTWVKLPAEELPVEDEQTSEVEAP